MIERGDTVVALRTHVVVAETCCKQVRYNVMQREREALKIHLLLASKVKFTERKTLGSCGTTSIIAEQGAQKQ